MPISDDLATQATERLFCISTQSVLLAERNLNSFMTMRTFSPSPRTLMAPGPSDVHPRVLEFSGVA